MTENNYLISIIVPVYNVGKYIKECVDSILKQTYTNIEIILVDDGSTDNSGKICDEYCEKHERIKVIHKQNAGLGLARNSGLEIAKGDYISFVDSDDWIKPDAIEQLFKSMEEKKVDFCKSGYVRFRNDGKILRLVRYQEECFPGEEAKLKLLPRMVGSSPSQHDSVEMSVWGCLYNARIIKEHGLRFPSERVLISEDFVFNLDYMQFSEGACLIPYSGYMYRLNPDSLTKCYRSDRFTACNRFYSAMEKRLVRYGYKEDTILRLKRIYFVYLRACIIQERKSASKKTISQSLSSIKTICMDSLLLNNIKSYPVKKLGTRQKVFLHLIQKKRILILKLLAELGLI